MTAPPENRRRAIAALPLTVAGVCLFIPLVALMWVDSYSRMTPTVIGIPFFYWYQMLWVLISTALTAVAYVLVRRHEKARKGGASR